MRYQNYIFILLSCIFLNANSETTKLSTYQVTITNKKDLHFLNSLESLYWNGLIPKGSISTFSATPGDYRQALTPREGLSMFPDSSPRSTDLYQFAFGWNPSFDTLSIIGFDKVYEYWLITPQQRFFVKKPIVNILLSDLKRALPKNQYDQLIEIVKLKFKGSIAKELNTTFLLSDSNALTQVPLKKIMEHFVYKLRDNEFETYRDSALKQVNSPKELQELLAIPETVRTSKEQIFIAPIINEPKSISVINKVELAEKKSGTDFVSSNSSLTYYIKPDKIQVSFAKGGNLYILIPHFENVLKDYGTDPYLFFEVSKSQYLKKIMNP